MFSLFPQYISVWTEVADFKLLACYSQCWTYYNVLNLPVGLFAFVEIWFYNDSSSAVCFYGYQQRFILFLSKPERANTLR